MLGRRASLALDTLWRRWRYRNVIAPRKNSTFSEQVGLLCANRYDDYLRYRPLSDSFLLNYQLLSLVSDSKGWIADLSCGAGQVLYLLSKMVPQSQPIGVDMDFGLLLLAKRFFNTRAEYICMDLSGIRLPFQDHSIASLSMLDAFALIEDKRFLVQEMERVTEVSGLITLAGLPNRISHPNPVGQPLSAREYKDLFKATTSRLFPSDLFRENFLFRDTMDLLWEAHNSDVERSRNFLLFATKDKRFFCRRNISMQRLLQYFDQWILSPLYQVCETNNAVKLTRKFPSRKYEKEYPSIAMRSPSVVTFSRDEWRQLLSNPLADQELLAKCFKDLVFYPHPGNIYPPIPKAS
jgi:ubiquinone/menaquinone biosynthesis C-methylase UbiE